MSYQKNTQKKSDWHKWLSQNKELIDICGLPAVIFASESHWWGFLEHGFLDHHDDSSNFTIDELSETELCNLKTLLNSVLPLQEKQSVVVLLQIESKLKNL